MILIIKSDILEEMKQTIYKLFFKGSYKGIMFC